MHTAKIPTPSQKPGVEAENPQPEHPQSQNPRLFGGNPSPARKNSFSSQLVGSAGSQGAKNPGSEKPAAGLYVRVSTLNQVDRDSLSTQESRLRAYCDANGFRVYKVYCDAGVSAKDTKRPQLEAMLEDCRRGKIKAVLVTALDRITRSLRDLIKLVDFFQENGIRFISITQNIDSSTSFGRFMRDLLGLIARLEREVDAERVSSDMHHRALLGKWNGGIVPYGYTTFQRIFESLKAKGLPEEQARKKAGELAPEPKKLYPDPEEAGVVRRIFETFLKTNSIRKTTHLLNSSGIRTRSGSTWASSSVHRILSNPTYTGKIWYGKRKTDLETGRLKNVREEEWKISEGEHEPIISEETFKKAQQALSSISRKPTRAFRTYLLSGLLRCGKCGGPMHGYTFTKRSSGREYAYYKCHNYSSKGPSVCEGNTVPAKAVEEFVVSTLMNLSKDNAFLRDREKMLAELKRQAEPKKREAELERLRREEKEIESRIETLLDKVESGLIDDSDFSRRYERLKERLRQNRLLQEKASDSADLSRAAYESLKASFEEISSFGKNWEFLDEQGKASRLSAIVKEIKVFEDRLEFQLYLDVKEASRRDRDSWQQPA